MNKIIISLLMLFCISCSNSKLFNNSSNTNISSNQDFINLQVKLHTAYSLLKSLNSGAINQEEYDRLKSDLFN